jgi:hypothetical protein
MQIARMVGDTDPPKIPKTQHFNAVSSRTSPTEAKGEFSTAPAPCTAGPPGPEMRNPATAGTGQGDFASEAVQSERRGAYSNRLSTAITWSITPDLLVATYAVVARAMP